MENKLRLLLVTETFPPEVNGVSLTLGMLAKLLPAKGWEIQILRPRQIGEMPGLNLTLGLPIPFYPNLRFGLASPRRLYKRIRAISPDLVHVATEGPLGLASMVAARLLKIPVVSSFHTNFDLYAQHYKLGFFKCLISKYLAWFHNKTRITLAPSNHTVERLKELGIHELAVWSRGVDTVLFHPSKRSQDIRDSLDLKQDDVLILHVGRLAVEKNLQMLLQAFGAISQKNQLKKKVVLAFVGEGPERLQLENLKIPSVFFVGQQRGEKLAQWYASADIFAFPSLSETFGNVVQEAQASGLPVVAFRSPVLLERIQDGKTGCLSTSIEEFSLHLQSLCEDKESRTKIGAAALKVVEGQSWENNIFELDKIYRQVLANGS